jgi:hypothetical protein
MFWEAALGAPRSISTQSVAVKLNSRIWCEAQTGLDVFICRVLTPVGPVASAEIQSDSRMERERSKRKWKLSLFYSCVIHNHFII